MVITRSTSPQNNGNLSLPFLDGNYPIFSFDITYCRKMEVNKNSPILST